MFRLLLAALILAWPLLCNAQDTTDDQSDVVDQVVDYMRTNDQTFITLLKQQGYEIRAVGAEGRVSRSPLNQFPARDPSLSGKDFTRIQEIDALAKNFEGNKWSDITSALAQARYNLTSQQASDFTLKTYISGECGKKRRALKIDDDMYDSQCKFKSLATIAKLQEDTDNCKRDTAQLHSNVAESEQQRLTYYCVRNLGWKDPTDWHNNVNY